MTEISADLSPPAALLRDLIRCPSVTPAEGGALGVLASRLQGLGFTVHRMVFSDEGTPDVENLYARLGKEAPHLCFAGHTDVVPPGDENAWNAGPFEGRVHDGMMYGRGAVDMKGGIACFLSAVESLLAEGPLPGSISLLITGDEEGPAINGTDKLLQWVAERGDTIDACILGEPTNPNALGDAIKIGRRGSVSGKVTVKGTQGHAAYPHLADNPVPRLMRLMDALLTEPLDEGTDAFQPTNLEVTSIDVGNPSVNVIPASASAHFNVRFNDTWSADSLMSELVRRLDEGAKVPPHRGSNQPTTYEIEWRDRPSHVFRTQNDALIDAVRGSVEAVTGRVPEISTGGGTSDARYIKDYAPVVEFGLVGQTMHQVDERVALADLDALTAIYQRMISDWFAGQTASDGGHG
ncbi:MAG: succinyl-diaminopimelate desuccinylase [Pseudomonadota bacterium]